MSALFDEVPVVLVHKENVADHWPCIMKSIQSSSYIAMDLEMTGLGNRKQLMSKDIEIRYSHIKTVAETRSVLSIGLSCFCLNGSTQPEFMVQTYNIILLCEDDYIVEPISMQFLVSHGFDFNQQYAKGIPYYRGNDKEDSPLERCRIRDLFSEIVRNKIPVVFHNALVDLVFIYQNFYSQLPSKLETFLADMSEMFAGGIIDTKYISDYVIRWPASYLEYTFRRCQIKNRVCLIGGEGHVMLDFPAYPVTCSDVEYRDCGLPTEDAVVEETPCENYAAHGNCPLRDSCPHSHDIDVILAVEFRDGIQYNDKKRNRKRKRKVDVAMEVGDGAGDARLLTEVPISPAQTNGHSPGKVQTDISESKSTGNKSTETEDEEIEVKKADSEIKDIETKKKRCVGHRAGFDAFMTGFILAHVISNRQLIENERINFSKLPDVMNNVYMSGKDIPLCVRKGGFSKTSKFHNEKLARLYSS